MKPAPVLRSVLLFLACGLAGLRVAAELPVDSYELRRSQAYALTDRYVRTNQKSPELEATLRALLGERPGDGGVLFACGRLAWQDAGALKPGTERRKKLQQVRDYFLRAREAGFNDPLIGTMLTTINADGTENTHKLSSRREVDKLLQDGERAFTAHDFDKAAAEYREALTLEPGNYLATVYAGDALFAGGKPQEALEWFEKACVLDPNREIAHRYAADALMRLGKRREALEHYVAAAVAEPYTGYPWRALNQYCEGNLIKPWTAPANLPTAQINHQGDKNELNLPQGFTPFDMLYGMARIKWQTENRAHRFPADKKYRLTLEEETSALRTMVKSYTELAQRSAQPPAEFAAVLEKQGMFLDQLVAIEAAGLLEAHVLFVRASVDKELTEDYIDYRNAHRELLRDYLTRFYLHLK